MTIAENTAKWEFVEIVSGYIKKLKEAQHLLNASQSLAEGADMASVFDGSFQADEAVSSTPRSPHQEQPSDPENV